MLYPFCQIADVEKYNQQREVYSADTTPTNTQVDEFMLECFSQIRGVTKFAGYDVDNFHETSSTVALEIAAGTKTVVLADGTEFNKGDIIKVEGLTSGLRAREFTEVSNVSEDDITANFINSYDAASVTIFIVNIAMEILRKINAVGAAWKAEDSAFMGVSPNRSEHAEDLMNMFFGSEELMCGLWAIMNLPEYLEGATKLDTTIVRRSAIQSYNEQNSGDMDTQPEITKAIEF